MEQYSFDNHILYRIFCPWNNWNIQLHSSVESNRKVEIMRIYKSPQVGVDEKKFGFEFSGDVVVATFDGIEDTFDFTGFPDGEVDYSMIETILEYNPVLKAKKVDGILSVELLNFISEDAKEEEKFPEWIEV